MSYDPERDNVPGWILPTFATEIDRMNVKAAECDAAGSPGDAIAFRARAREFEIARDTGKWPEEERHAN